MTTVGYSDRCSGAHRRDRRTAILACPASIADLFLSRFIDSETGKIPEAGFAPDLFRSGGQSSRRPSFFPQHGPRARPTLEKGRCQESATASGKPNSDLGAPKCRRDPSRRAIPNVRPDLLPTVHFATTRGANGKPSLGRGASNGRLDSRRRPSATGRPDLVATIHTATPTQNGPD